MIWLPRCLREAMAAYWYGRTLGKFHRNRFAQALRAAQRTRRFDPGLSEDPVFMSVVGQCLARLGAVDDATHALEKAEDLFRSLAPADDYQARARSEAARTLETIRRASPGA